MKKVKKTKKGFTLIELVAVIAILAILAAAIVPQVSKYIERSQKTAIQALCREVVTAVESYNAEADAKNQILLSQNGEILLASVGNAGVVVPLLESGYKNPTIATILTAEEFTEIQDLLGVSGAKTDSLGKKFNKIPEATKYSEILDVSKDEAITIKNGKLETVKGQKVGGGNTETPKTSQTGNKG